MKLTKNYPIAAIATLLNAKLIPGTASHINGINEIHKVTTGDLSFVDHPKYYQKVLQSAAAAVLINSEEVENTQGKALLISEDPIRDYNWLALHFRAFEPMTKNISETATIGAHTVIQAGAVIGNHVKIGKNCLIYPNVTIYDYTEIGDNVIIHANSVIGADAYYYQKREEGFLRLQSCGKVIIENRAEIGAGCTIDRGVSGDTIIGEDTKLDNHIHIGHGVVIGKHCLLAAQVGIAGKTVIGDHVTIWGQVGISKSLTIGDHAVVLAQSGVDKSLKGGKTYFGSPAHEARSKWREMAQVRRIPDILERLKKLEKPKN